MREVISRSRKIQALKTSEGFDELQKKMQDDWKMLNSELRECDEDRLRLIQGSLSYLKELFDWIEITAYEERLLTEEEKRQEIDNDY